MSVQNILNGEQRTLVITVTVHTEENIYSDDEADEMLTTETRKWSNQNEGKYLTAYKYILIK